MNIKSIQEEDGGIQWVGCDMSWQNTFTVVKDLSFMPSAVVLSLVHQTEDLALKSPKIIVNKALLVVASLKIVSKFGRKFWNSIASWLRDLYATQYNLCFE